MVSLMVKCRECGALTSAACTCDWVVKVTSNGTFPWARYRAVAKRGDFIYSTQFTAYGWTQRQAERRIRQALRRFDKCRLVVKEFRIERSKP